MCQLEVKRTIVQNRCLPCNGWSVNVGVDAMERTKGGWHTGRQKEAAALVVGWLVSNGVKIGAHPRYDRAVLVALKPDSRTLVVKVEDQSSRRKEQAVISTLGQTLVSMKEDAECMFIVAAPDTSDWEKQLRKVPARI